MTNNKRMGGMTHKTGWQKLLGLKANLKKMILTSMSLLRMTLYQSTADMSFAGRSRMALNRLQLCWQTFCMCDISPCDLLLRRLCISDLTAHFSHALKA